MILYDRMTRRRDVALAVTDGSGVSVSNVLNAVTARDNGNRHRYRRRRHGVTWLALLVAPSRLRSSTSAIPRLPHYAACYLILTSPLGATNILTSHLLLAIITGYRAVALVSAFCRIALSPPHSVMPLC